jgi:hypothetical protein
MEVILMDMKVEMELTRSKPDTQLGKLKENTGILMTLVFSERLSMEQPQQRDSVPKVLALTSLPPLRQQPQHQEELV